MLAQSRHELQDSSRSGMLGSERRQRHSVPLFWHWITGLALSSLGLVHGLSFPPLVGLVSRYKMPAWERAAAQHRAQLAVPS